jgi:hypothetical protein
MNSPTSATPSEVDAAPSDTQRRDQVIALFSQIKQEMDTDPAFKRMVSDTLGTSMATQQAKPRTKRSTTEDAHNFVLAAGENVHRDPNFKPRPPEHILEAGDYAIELFHQTWEDGFQRGEIGGFNDDMITNVTPELGVLPV